MRKPASSLALVVFALALAPAAAAQVSLFSWSLAGSPQGSGTLAGEQLFVVGPDGSVCSGSQTYFATTAPAAGRIIVDVVFTNLDSACHYDAPAWLVDGVLFKPDSSGCWPTDGYHIEFDVAAGDTFGLGVWSADCSEGAGQARFHDLQFVTGGWTDLGHALDPRIGLVASGLVPGGEFGDAVAGAGDVNGDGVPDLIVGAHLEGPQGVARLLSGADGSVLHTFANGTNESQFGWAVAGVGDLDGDSVPDVAVGAPFDDTPLASSGSVSTYSGATGELIFKFDGTDFASFLGRAVIGAGDLDGDGFDDLLVGAPYNGTFKKSHVFALGGPDGHVIWELLSPTFDSYMGQSFAVLDDLDGDGTIEFAIGAPHGTYVGWWPFGLPTEVYIVSGRTGEIRNTLTGTGQYGFALASLADLDGDNHRDLAIGAPNFGSSGSKWGRIHVVSPAKGAQLMVKEALVPGGQLGQTLAGGGDLDGDGQPDLAVGAPTESHDGALGFVHVLSLPGLAAEWKLSGEVEQFGRALALGGDTDGDGLDELLVGSPLAQGSTGLVRVFTAVDGQPAPHIKGTGSLKPNSSLTLSLDALPPSQVSWLIVGVSALNSPFKGGTLVPNPNLLVPLGAGPSGQLTLNATWPAFPVPWTSLWFQIWAQFPGGPYGWIASNGLRATGNP